MAFQLPKQKANNNGSSELAGKFHGNNVQETKGKKGSVLDDIKKKIASGVGKVKFENKRIEKLETPAVTPTNVEIVRKKLESGEGSQNLIDWQNSDMAKKMLRKSMIESGSTRDQYVLSALGDRYTGVKKGTATSDAEFVRNARIKNLSDVDVKAMTEEEWTEFYGEGNNPGTLGRAVSGRHKYNIDRIAKEGEKQEFYHGEGQGAENVAEDVIHHEYSHSGDEYNPVVWKEDPNAPGFTTSSYRYKGLTQDVVDKMGFRTGIEIPGSANPQFSQRRLIPKSDVEFMKNLADPAKTTIEGHMKTRSAFADKKFQDLDQGDKDFIAGQIKFNAYVADPSETRARVNSGRQSMRGLGIDIFNKKVTKDDLEKWKETGDFEYKQLQNVYGEDGMLKLFNTISANTDDLDFDLKGATDKNINYA